jgi:hypothetical protein
MLLPSGAFEWEVIGLVCLSPAGPTIVDDLADRLHDLVIEEVPSLEPSFQPRGGTLVELPAIFASGQPRRLGVREFSLVGFDIVLRGEATWTWRFGDGHPWSPWNRAGNGPTTRSATSMSNRGAFERR